MWQVMWLQGAMERWTMGLAQIKQTSPFLALCFPRPGIRLPQDGTLTPRRRRVECRSAWVRCARGRCWLGLRVPGTGHRYRERGRLRGRGPLYCHVLFLAPCFQLAMGANRARQMYQHRPQALRPRMPFRAPSWLCSGVSVCLWFGAADLRTARRRSAYSEGGVLERWQLCSQWRWKGLEGGAERSCGSARYVYHRWRGVHVRGGSGYSAMERASAPDLPSRKLRGARASKGGAEGAGRFCPIRRRVAAS